MSIQPIDPRPAEQEPYFPKGFTFNLDRVMPSVITDIATAAVLQYIAGLIVPPTLVVMSEHSVAVQPGSSTMVFEHDRKSMPATLIFRQIYQAEIPALGRQFWMVTVQALDSGTGDVESSPNVAPAQFYIFNSGGWTHNFDFVHRLVHKPDLGAFREDIDQGMEFPVPMQRG